MAYRCPSCEKFCSLEGAEPEVQEFNVDENGVTANVRVMRTCMDCGEEICETYLDLEGAIDHHCEKIDNGEYPEYTDPDGNDVEEPEFEYTESGGGRYQKNMIGCCADITMKCAHCGEEITVHLEDSVPASYFESLV